ncbi:hypothetical protein [Paenibacillus donghaensis]|uniref:Uncharacterized protein n=1 Tax=Paenibacillus donghaensis TaxID=414771 RepID=A0A2Z2KUY7_9BACL|nr:hypothetical protein [Paenibacillus donghaensis]ASA25982.1 hypothetical protein B9T62_37910 [Paenibacillus donghaensis]
MDVFKYEVTSESTINLKYEYGGEYFTFNLFRSDGLWILHPFDGILIGNQAMCLLVVQELFKHKAFQVMLAKENILFSNIRSSVELDSMNSPIAVRNERGAYEEDPEPADDLMDFVQGHTLEEIIDFEASQVKERCSFYKDILQRMFMDDLGPSDPEFRKVQEIVKIYEQTADKLTQLNGPNLDTGGGRRW